MKKKIAVLPNAFLQNKNLVSELDLLKKKYLFKKKKVGQKFSEIQLIKFLQDCDGAIIGLEKINNNVLEKCKRLKLIVKFGVGLDNIDFAICRKKKVQVKFKTGVNARSVSEAVLSSAIMLSRNLYVTSNLLKKGAWIKNGGFQISNKTFGIIGCGNIGKDLIKLLKPFNCNILINDIINLKKYCKSNNIKQVSKNTIFEKSDVISLHVPLTDKTYNLINQNTLKKMKKNIILINFSRGGIVNEGCIENFLMKKKIFGFATDVYQNEPPRKNLRILQFQNVINTPHIGGNSVEAVLAMGRAAINNLK